MCGIFGFVSSRPRPAAIVMAGLRYLEYRGYDSWGIAAAVNGRVEIEKAVGQIGRAEATLGDASAVLGHTRWATHGGVTRANAHPHVDCGGRLALIHNGIVENHQNLRHTLQREHNFHSQTDTEVLVHLLEEQLDQEPDLLCALRAVFQMVEGLSAVAVLDAGTGHIAVVKNGSPIALGLADDGYFIASDANALLEYTHEIVFVEDGQGALMTPETLAVIDLKTGQMQDTTVQTLLWDAEVAGLDGYAHFMDKEIHEQPGVLRRVAENMRTSATTLAAMIEASDHVYLIGCGTAHHAALSGRYMLSEIAGKHVNTAVASEMSLVYPVLTARSLVIALSQSGETIDVLDAVKEARRRGASIASLTNTRGSALDRLADFTVLLECGPERCVLSTKSYIAKLAVLQLTARALAGDVERGILDIDGAAQALTLLLASQSLLECIVDVARKISEHQHLFILGRHREYPLALEAALKIKEVSYLHAEGFAAGELKHGVIALITQGTPCMILASVSDYRRESLAAASEVKARGAFTIGLSPYTEDEFLFTIPTTSGAGAQYEIAVICQLLAYHMALLRGCDPDKPRNLAKSVTVK